MNLQLLDRFPLREDEALYSYWSLSLRHEDFLMRYVWPDKPPLFLWAQAAMFEGVGASQAGARLLNIGLTTATVAVVAVTGRRLWGAPVGDLSALLLALNPFAISFAATAYTDPLLVFCGQLAFYLALSGRALGAGIWLAAAIMTKQQGLLYVPLVLFPLLWRSPHKGRDGIRWLLGLALVTLPILYWDMLRWNVAPSPWDLSVRNYAPLALVPATAWWDRLQRWAELLWYFGANRWVWFSYLFLIGAGCSSRAGMRDGVARRGGILLLIGGWCGGYLLLHLITTINIWDRYLLPLVPMSVLLCAALIARSVSAPANNPIPQRRQCNWLETARAGKWGNYQLQRAHTFVAGYRLAIILFVTLLLLPTGLRAATGALPIGGDRGAYAGLVEAVDWLQTQKEPFVLYHQRLGWHYRFYLFPQLQTGQVDLRWFADAVYLADNAAKFPYQHRFYIQPAWYNVSNLRLHLATRRMALVARARFGTMRVYEIVNQPQSFCTWCRCGPAASHRWVPLAPSLLPEGELFMSPIPTPP